MGAFKGASRGLTFVKASESTKEAWRGLEGAWRGARRGLEGGLKGAWRGLEGRGPLRGLQGGFKWVSRGKGASRGLQGGFKGASRWRGLEGGLKGTRRGLEGLEGGLKGASRSRGLEGGSGSSSSCCSSIFISPQNQDRLRLIQHWWWKFQMLNIHPYNKIFNYMANRCDIEVSRIYVNVLFT